MCFSGGPSLPAATDPKAERLQAEAEATASANAKAAADRRKRQQQSLLATGAAGATGSPVTSSVLATGKTKLGT